MKQFHVRREGKRTTITLLPILEELLTIKIGSLPDEKDSLKKARRWLQEQVDCFDDESEEKLSQWLQKQVIMFISHEETLRTWQNWNNTKNG